MSDLDTNAYYAFGVPAYLVLIAFEVWLRRRRGLDRQGVGHSICNLTGGLGEVVLGLFIGPILIGLYVFGYEHLRLVEWPAGSPWPWVLAFLLGDLCYYWYHRAGHRFGALWAIHGVHHQSDEMNFTVALRHPWFSDVYSFVFYIPLPMAGVAPTQFFVAISVISFYALFVHTEIYDFPGLGVLVTPRSHLVHHCRNPRYIGRNLGAMFTIWDRLFGTHTRIVPEDPPDLGTPDGYRTHDGAHSQFLYFIDLFRSARAARTWREGLQVLVRRPGWRPPGVAARAPVPARPEGRIEGRVQAHVLGQFAVACTLAVFVLWFRDRHPLAVQIPAAALVFAACATLGRLLDGRPDGARLETLRLAAGAFLAVAWIGRAGGLVPGGLLLAAMVVGLATVPRTGRPLPARRAVP